MNVRLRLIQHTELWPLDNGKFWLSQVIWHMTCDKLDNIWHMTHDTWHMTYDIWHMIYDTWHMTHTYDMWQITLYQSVVLNRANLSLFQITEVRWSPMGCSCVSQSSQVITLTCFSQWCQLSHMSNITVVRCQKCHRYSTSLMSEVSHATNMSQMSQSSQRTIQSTP